LKKANKELNKNIPGFSQEVLDLFHRYPWPGNLRELNNIIKRSALLSDSERIELSALPPEIIHFEKFNFSSGIQAVNGTQSTPDLKSVALVAEQEMITNILRQVNNNKSKAAKLLNIDRKTLYNKMKQLHIN
jgi:two-component system response regulator HydG